MPATNATTNYELPIFIGTDKPSWMGDWNGAMNKIDAALATAAANATAAMTTANAASTTAQAAQTAVTALETKVNSIETTVQTQAMEISENAQDIQQIQSQISQIPTGVQPLNIQIKKPTWNGFTPTVDLTFYQLGSQFFVAGKIDFGTPTSSNNEPLNVFYDIGSNLPCLYGVGQIQGNPFNLQGGQFVAGNTLPNVLYSVFATVTDNARQHELNKTPQTSPGPAIKFYLAYDSVSNTTVIFGGCYVTYKATVPFSLIAADPLTTIPSQTLTRSIPAY